MTDHPESAAADLGRRWGLDATELLESPYAVVGTVDAVAEIILKRRDDLGATYFTWNETEMERMAPVVRLLA